jgi:hypothetical protein
LEPLKTLEKPWKTLKNLEKPCKILKNPWKHLKNHEKPRKILKKNGKNLKTLENPWNPLKPTLVLMVLVGLAIFFAYWEQLTTEKKLTGLHVWKDRYEQFLELLHN